MKNFAIVFASLILVLASIGAFANGSIGFGQFAIQTTIGILAEWRTLKRINA